MFKYILIITIILLSTVYLQAETDYHPRLIVAELITASWSNDAPEAYSGVDEVMVSYHHGEVIPVRYYTSQDSGEYSSPSVENLIQDYTTTAFPSMIVNGQTRLSGVNTALSNGEPYKSMIEKEYYKPSPVKMEITSFNPLSGEVQVLITMLSSSVNLQNVTARFIMIEDAVANGVTNLARIVEEQTFSLSGQNNTITLNQTLNPEPSWDEDNLFTLVYVTDSLGEIIQAASSYPTPDYYLRTVVPNQRIDLGPSSGLFEVDYFILFNMGNSLDLTISASMDEAPDTWFLTYCDDDGLCYFGPHDFSMNSGVYERFHANIVPDSRGMMDYSFILSGSSLTEDYIIPFRYITNDVTNLIIDGDGWADYESYSAEVFISDQQTYGIWDTNFADLTAAVSQTFHTLVWVAGEREPALSHKDTDFLRAHLDNGRKLFVSGQNIGKDLIVNPLYQDIDFYNNYLNADFISANTDYRQLSGRAGDAISDGMNFYITGEDGANNQMSPEVIAPNQQYGIEIFYYPDSSIAGLRSVLGNNNGKVVYLPFGFEAINTPSDRLTLLTNALNWLNQTSVDDPQLPVEISPLQLLPSFPNPFSLAQNYQNSRSNQYVTIPYYIASERLADDASISIFNIKGQLIKTLTDIRLMDNKSGYVIWDGKNENNRSVVSGVYFYKLSNGNESQIRKMLIVN